MPHTFVQGYDLAGRIAKALGVDSPVRSVAVLADCRRGVPLVSIRFHPTVEQAGAIEDVLKEYRLVEARANVEVVDVLTPLRRVAPAGLMAAAGAEPAGAEYKPFVPAYPSPRPALPRWLRRAFGRPE